jgi:CDP-glycerol glycerophosphotransferase (TagB/SpsB family)
LERVLTIVSNQGELNNAISRAGEDCELTVLSHLFSPYSLVNEKVLLTTPKELLTDKEFEEIEGKAAFFARNWHLFDKKFAQETTFNGISLGILHENDLSYFFRTTLMLVKGILKEIEKNPAKIVVNENSFVGEAVKIAAKARNFNRIEFLDLQTEKAYDRLPNVSRKKAGELKKNLSKIFEDLLASKNKNGKTVFVRARGYLGNIESALREEPELNVVSLDKFLLKTILNPLNFYRYISTRTVMRKKFKKLFDKLSASKQFREKFVFEKVNFSSLFEQMFPQLVKRDWPEFVFLIKTLSKLFDKQKPSAVVLWADTVAFERTCAILAKRSGAKSIVLQHGIFKPILKKGDWARAFAPLTADKIAVWGKRFKDYLVSHEVPTEKVIVTGAPRFDVLANKGEVDKEFLEKIGAKNRGVVVFAAQTDTTEIAKDLINAMAEFKGKQLVIKIHPMADSTPYEKIVNEMNSNTIIMRGQLHELLQASSALVTHSSTVGLEAMILGKPIIVFDKKSDGQDMYGGTNAIFRVGNVEELKEALQTVFSKKGSAGLQQRIKKFVFEMLFKQDGKATERVVAIVKEMVV